MRLLHYTPAPLEHIRSVEQSGDRYRDDKPEGLWISVEGEDDWLDWCEQAEYDNPAAQICYEIVLADDSRVLHLATSGDLRIFTELYKSRGSFGGIDWQRVAEQHDGIIIAPYQWSCRLDHETRWYYGWDCASGCLWSRDAVADVQLRLEGRA